VIAWGKLSKTQPTLPDQAGPGAKEERFNDLWFQEALSWRALRLPARSPNSNCSNSEGQKRQATRQEERAIDPLRHSRGVVLEKPCDSASPETAVAQRHARQETAQWTSAATPADITGSHVAIAARSSLGSAGTSRTSSIRVKPV